MFFARAYLWFGSNLLLLLALFWIFHRKLHRQQALFSIYLALELAWFATGLTEDFLIVRHLASRNLYLWTVIVGLGLSAVTELAVLYKLTAELIFSRLKNSMTVRTTVRWTLGVLVLLGVGVSGFIRGSSPERLVDVFQSLNIAIYVIALGLLFAIVLLSKAFSIHWRGLHAGVALGFGIAAAGELAGSGILSEFGQNKSGYIASDLVRMSAFHVCALIWLIYVLLPERRPSHGTPAFSVTDLESRAEELQRMVQR